LKGKGGILKFMGCRKKKCRCQKKCPQN